MERCTSKGIGLADKTVVFSGCVSSGIVLKISKMRISILIARSAPTTLALKLAEELGNTAVNDTMRH
jgi:FdhD protein